MDEDQMKAAESRGYRDVAWEYREAAYGSLRDEHPRLAVDTGYNAAELCAKGLLVLKIDDLPNSHDRVVIKFGDTYIKEGPLPRRLGRDLNKCLAFKNKSRCDPHARIGRDEADEVLKLADTMVKVLHEELRKTKY